MVKDINLKTKVLDNGWKILTQKGREALNIRDLAKQSGCSIGTIYNLFENLDEIVLLLNLRCLEKLYGGLHSEMKQAIQEKGNLHTVFQKLGKSYIRFGMENPKLWKSLFENLAIDPLPSWYRETVRAGIKVAEQTIQNTFGLKEEKIVRMVSFFWAAMHGMTSIMLNKKMEVIDEAIDEAYVTAYIESCLCGFVD